MPDWSYQTLFRPMLFQLPSRVARALTLTSIGTLSRIPGGTFVIRTLGHMEPSPLLESESAGVTFQTPVGMSGTVDPTGTAHRAIAQFGFGFMEIGPITVEPVRSSSPILVDQSSEQILYPSYYENDGITAAVSIVSKPGHPLPQFARLTPLPGSSIEQSAEQIQSMHASLLNSGAAGFYYDVLQQSRKPEEAIALLTQIQMSTIATHKPAYIYLPFDLPESTLEHVLASIDCSDWDGIVIGESISEDGQLHVGSRDKEMCIAKIRHICRHASNNFIVKAACGLHEPQDALDLLEAGAQYVILHSGFIFSGPGLPKRINEAILHERLRSTPVSKLLAFWSSWGWMCFLGAGMVLGGIIAWLIAATTVLLPYDEAFLGMDHSELQRNYPKLLHFMSHDRITLAGTMMSLGILYFQLARHGLKDGLHWSRTALLTSGIVGFSSFLLYLGYGYFDPLHALAAAILLPMFILSMRNSSDKPFHGPVNVHNDRSWRLGLWGQLCFVALGFALAIGGLTIAGVGVTSVFVPEDLAFLGMTTEQIREISPQLIPLIAHDRAGFGGALFSDALAILVMALWGIQQGARWLWWTFLLGGAPAFFAVFSIHLHIGYRDLWHLSPAIFALLLYIAGLILLHPYLTKKTV